MRILFAMQAPDYVRFYDSTIRELARRGHRIVIAVTRMNEVKGVKLEGFVDADTGIFDGGRLPKRVDVWSAFVRALRGTMDFVRYLDPCYAAAPVLRARMKHKVLPVGFRFLDWIPSLPRPMVRRLLRLLAAVESAVPVDPRTVGFLAKQRPDLVIVTPLIEAASPLVDTVRGAQSLGIPVGACIASWDNLTNKGHMRVKPDGVMVWNELQKSEAIELHEIPADRVAVTGAQVFDRWFARQPTLGRADFCEMVGLPADRPMVLFTGSSSFISKLGDDVEFVRRWIEALRASDDPAVRDASVLYRPHPYYYAHWSEVDLSDLGHAVVWPRDYVSILDDNDREHYFNTLYHCAAVVGINTSAMIEAAILGKPVHSILLDEFSGTQEGTLHFRYLMPENGGFLWIGRSLQQHVEQLTHTLSADFDASRTREFIEGFLRPRGIERPCTPFLADEIERLGRLEPAPSVNGWSRRATATLMLPAAFVAKAMQALSKGKPLSRKSLFGR